MTHTPGPWAMSGDIIHGPMEQPPNPKAQKFGHVICKLGWDFDGDRGRTGDLPWKTAEANARLIAAAPDLLATLEKAIHWIDADDQGGPEMIGQCRTVIAKATS